MRQQCAQAAKGTNHIVECTEHSTASWSREAMLLVHLELVQPPLRYCVWFWASQQKKHVKVLECIQRRAWSASIDFCGKAGAHHK